MRIFILLQLVTFWFTVNAQTPYNFALDHGLSHSEAELVHELEEHYLCIGRGNILFIQDRSGIYTYLVDKSTGELSHVELIRKENYFLFMGHHNSTYEYNNIVYFPFSSVNTIYIGAYDVTKDSSFTIVDTLYTHNTNTSVFLTDMVGDQENITIYASLWNVDEEMSNRYIYTYNIITHESEQRLIDNLGISRFVIHYAKSDQGNDIFVGQANNVLNIQEVDSTGTVLWDYIDNDNRLDLGFGVTSIGNDAYLISCIRFEFEGGSKHIPILLRFDAKEKRVVWIRNYSYNDFYTALNGHIDNIIPSPVDADNYLISGEAFRYDTELDTSIGLGFVSKIDIDGDIKWRRDYFVRTLNGVGHTIVDMIATSDGHYLCYGDYTYWREIPDSTKASDTWIFKIDEDGHIVADTGSSTSEWKADGLTDISIYPNPAQDVLYINQDDIQDITYRAIDMDGRIIDEIVVRDAYQSGMIDIHDWPSGLIFISVLQEGKQIGVMKLVKQ